MKNLYFLSYNNYFNRTIKRLSSLEEYREYMVGNPLTNVNFVPNDGVHTSQIVNADYEFEDTPDYCIVCDPVSDEVLSRWFVIEVSRIRSGQYEIQLKRDSVADHLDSILLSKSYIMKGCVDPSNPIIYNSEGFTVNQIKTKETLLKDSTNTAWIVGYISPDVATDHPIVRGQIEGFISGEYSSWELAPGYKFRDRKNIVEADSYVDINGTIPGKKNTHWRWGFQGQTGLYTYRPWYNTGTELIGWFAPGQWTIQPVSVKHKIFEDSIQNHNVQAITEQDKLTLLSLDGQYIKVEGQEYQIKVYTTDISDAWPWPIVDTNNVISDIFHKTNLTLKPNSLHLGGTYYTMDYLPVTHVTNLTHFTYDFTNKDLSNEISPYSIICLPWSTGIGDNLSGQSRLKILQALGSTIVYDIQILPYCPIRTLSINSNNEIVDTNPNYSTIDVSIDTTPDAEKPTPGTKLTSIRISRTPQFSFKIPCKIDIDDVKLDNETKMWRLNSPNYNGVFEFNAAKFYHGSKTAINYFSVDCCYRPYNPYIHIAPEWNGLYGKDFNDARGLICGGDFSTDRISDQWASYQYENKNFQLQFDRQIESMELQKNIGLGETIANGLGQAVGSSTIAGAIGGPWAAAGMAAIGIAQTGYNAWAQQRVANDQIDATKDQHAWELQNIQARPYGLTKVGVLNQNNKLFPFVEEFDCTEEEREAVRQKIISRGMTINRIGTIHDYINIYKYPYNYIEATLIRANTTIKEDAHMINDINNELSGGLYIYD